MVNRFLPPYLNEFSSFVFVFARVVKAVILILVKYNDTIFTKDTTKTIDTNIKALKITFTFNLSIITVTCTVKKVSNYRVGPTVALNILLSNEVDKGSTTVCVIFRIVKTIVNSTVLCTLISANTRNNPATANSGKFTSKVVLRTFVTRTIFAFVFILIILNSASSRGKTNGLTKLTVNLALMLIRVIYVPIAKASIGPTHDVNPTLFRNNRTLSRL